MLSKGFMIFIFFIKRFAKLLKARKVFMLVYICTYACTCKNNSFYIIFSVIVVTLFTLLNLFYLVFLVFLFVILSHSLAIVLIFVF